VHPFGLALERKHVGWRVLAPKPPIQFLECGVIREKYGNLRSISRSSRCHYSRVRDAVEPRIVKWHFNTISDLDGYVHTYAVN